ncbi:UNVERIFIED_CONTAM: hypothetical protein RMT77_006576 [Armadillidium vulgare]
MATDRSDNVQQKEKNRRSNKPLMEKRRRERINKSLNELKDIVLKAQNKDTSKFTKLEKADILEMTVKHLKKLDESGKISHNTNNSQFCEKYKQGFEKCLVEVENYIRRDDTLHHQHRSKQIILHLKTLFSKIPPEELCKHTLTSANQTNKVKATVDTSVFNSAIITLTHPEEQRLPTAVILPHHQQEHRVPTIEISPRFHREQNTPTAVISPHSEKQHHIQTPKTLPENSYIKQSKIEFSNGDTRVGVENYPPSPPDSLRYSSSPDSLRGSPRSSIDYNSSLNQMAFEKQIPSIPFMESSNYSIKHETECENIPLNLTVPSITHRQENFFTNYHPSYKSSRELQSSPTSSEIVKKEELTYQNSNHIYHQPFEQQNPEEKYVLSNALEPTKGGGPSRASHSSNRTAPYPKKEAVKRYQNENSPVGDAEGRGGQRDQNAQPKLQHEGLTQSHWRPW